ncbi:MAG: class I SAM-dependent methyltransferase [Burkholderiaceae bacterium]|nr:class I SAM-dependent methyltransferase [Burkholderiaceae bacterium]
MASSHLTPTGPAPATDGVTEEWLDSHLPGVFASGHQWLVEAQRASSKAIIAAAEVDPGDHVVDVACGSGIPTILLARAVEPGGRVTAVDPSPVLIDALTQNVREAGLDNVDIVQASAMTLPFADATFDAATCHFGAMFFPDLPAGLAGIRRGLKPGARAAFAGWGPIEENTHLGPFFVTLARHLGPRPAPPNPSEAPWPMRFAIPSTLSAGLEAAGYEDIREEQPILDIVWPGPPETLLEFWMNMANLGPEVPAETRSAIEGELLDHLRSIERDGTLPFTARITIGSGRNAA